MTASRLVVLLFFMAACGNTADKEYVSGETSDSYDPAKITCIGQPCKTHADCTCAGADICIHSTAGMDPAIGENIHLCTIPDCTEGVETSCPPGYVCHRIPMANQLFDNAVTMCIIDLEVAEPADAVQDSND